MRSLQNQQEALKGKPMKAVWTDSVSTYERNLQDASEAIALAYQLQTSRRNAPVMLEVCDPLSGTALSVGLGRAESVVTYQASLDPPYFISLGDKDKSGLTSFFYGNEQTEYLARNVVPWQEGIRALQQFLLDRSRPTCLAWEKL